ncbi:MAG: DNA internalization-related competence protein ComEC/Rec2, partial [Bacillota bacterium]|nr:DNA internalization-related competence protein ComEC/Rec2 [Bacillota bacterium]
MDGEISVDGDRLQEIVIDEKTNEKLLMKYIFKSSQEKYEIENIPVQKLLCRVSGELKKPTQANNPNAFQYETFLNRQQLYWIFLAKTNPFQSCMKVKASPLSLIKQLRSTGIKYLNDHFPSDIASLSSALIFGDREFIQPELLSAYQKIGIIHLLAISGLHVSLLMGMIFYVGIRIGITKEKMSKFLLAFLPIYAILTGGTPSVIRSVMMIFIGIAARKWRHVLKLQPCDAISLTLMFYLLLSPFSIFEVGFELSFAVSFALVISSSFIMKNYHNNLVRMLVTSFISQLSALPFLLYHFFEISLISVLVNLIFIPLYSFVLLPGVFLLAFWMFLIGAIPSPVITAFVHLIHFSNQLAVFFAAFKFLNIVTGRPSSEMLLLIFASCMFVFIYWEKNMKGWKVILLWVMPFFLLLLLQSVNRHLPVGEVTMIDVGQGDSILIKLPQGKGTYLIDTGGTPRFENEQWRQSIHSFEAGKDIVVPFLKGKGITVIDKLILTHGDMD